MKELKKCPFCGKTDTLEVGSDRRTGYWNVVCNYNLGGCGASSGYRKEEKDAIEAWNRRKGEEK